MLCCAARGASRTSIHVASSNAQEYLGIGGGTGEPAQDAETFDELFYNLSVLENLGKGSAGSLSPMYCIRMLRAGGPWLMKASQNMCAADTSDAAIQGDNTAAWDSDDEPQQSEGSFAIADLLAGFSGPSSRTNGSSLGPSRRDDDAGRGDMDVAVLSPADYLLGELGAPTQVCASPPTCASAEPT